MRDTFFAFVAWSPVAYLVLMVIHVVMCKVDDVLRGNGGASSTGEDILGAVIEDVGNPLLDIWIPVFRAKDNDSSSRA